MGRVLVIAPHPDDESIGCGGAVCQHVLEGDTVRVIFLTSGEKGGHGRSEAETARLREQEALAAVDILGVAEYDFWREPDGNVCSSKRLVSRLNAEITERPPNVVYVTHAGEMHRDHRAAARLVVKSLRQWPTIRASQPPEAWMYEVWTPMHTMDHIVDISDHIDRKLQAIRAYKTQCDVLRFDDAIRGLNRYRGEMHSWPGGPYAEIFRKLAP